MSLKQKFTWNDFKKEQGEKAKSLKRTSAEGKKAFEAALKARVKKYVEDRVSRYQKQKQSAEKGLDELTQKLKGLKSANRRKSIIKKVHRKQRAMKKFNNVIANDQARSL